MDRLFALFLMLAVLICGPGSPARREEQPVFFSLLFPQLIPEDWKDQEWFGGTLWL